MILMPLLNINDSIICANNFIRSTHPNGTVTTGRKEYYEKRYFNKR